MHSTVSEAIKPPQIVPLNSEQPLNRSRRLVVNRSRPATSDPPAEIRSSASKNSSDLIAQSGIEKEGKDMLNQSLSSSFFLNLHAAAKESNPTEVQIPNF